MNESRPTRFMLPAVSQQTYTKGLFAREDRSEEARRERARGEHESPDGLEWRQEVLHDPHFRPALAVSGREGDPSSVGMNVRDRDMQAVPGH